ncbi:MAG: hypothetical protein HFF17_01715 [Oscillospiraceae bacterium]|nr:hypothetical protein [Oscillospiraceae bacterium]
MKRTKRTLRRTLSLLMAAVLLLTSLGVSALAAGGEGEPAPPAADATIIYGRPALGGQTLDAGWAKCSELLINQHATKEDNATNGKAKLMWDEENLFLLVTVEDADLDKSSAQNHEQDSVEVFVDQTNAKSNSLSGNLHHYRARFDSYKSYGTNTGDGSGFEVYAKTVSGGYQIEMKIPFDDNVQPEAGGKIGLELQINDATGGRRIDEVKWHSKDTNSWQNGSIWGTAELAAKQADSPIAETPAAFARASVASGGYRGAQSVTLSSRTADATIYYTTDGTAPTEESTEYTGPVTVDEDTVLKTIATAEGRTPSVVSTYTYRIGYTLDELPSLWEEYEDYFPMGTFGDDWSSPTPLKNWNISAISNNLKLSNQIGENNPWWDRDRVSPSRQRYLETVAEIEADDTLTEAEKEAALQKANETVVLDPEAQAQGKRMLDAIRQWNQEHPDQEPKTVRGHVLAWHGPQQPDYFFCDGFICTDSSPAEFKKQVVDRETMLARLDNYIRLMMEDYSEYKDIIIAWDVVNEAVDDYSGQIRNVDDPQFGEWGTVFRREDLTGDKRLYEESEWVRQAFASARKWSKEYGCDWKLYYNDYQDSNKDYEPKMSQTIKMVGWIPDENIDGFGLQGRLSFASPSVEFIKEQIRRILEETGCEEISFTESDIRSDFVPNPFYDSLQPSRPITAQDPQWPAGSGSMQYKGASNGNTFDTHNSPAMRNPAWDPENLDRELSVSPQIMKKQADYAADLMDMVISYAKKGQVGAYLWDGLKDNNTFNGTTGCTMWDYDGLEKYSFFAVAGAPVRDKMSTALANGPVDSDASRYTAESWAAYQTAKTAAEALVDARIYDLDDFNAAKEAAENLDAAKNALVSSGSTGGGTSKPSQSGGSATNNPGGDTTPVPPATPSDGFRDVAPNAWYREPVDFMVSRGYMSGTGTGTFAPDATTNRAMVVTILARFANGKPVNPSAMTDVAAGQWYSDAVAWAVENNIVSGYGDGAFGPNDPVTREQLATILYRYAGSPAITQSLSAYSDAGSVSSYAQAAMQWCVANGILSGYANGTLRPAGNATRAEMAKMFTAFIQVMNG